MNSKEFGGFLLFGVVACSHGMFTQTGGFLHFLHFLHFRPVSHSSGDDFGTIAATLPGIPSA
ncbi:MAG: hypothetical protein NTW21_06210 [Verrucomicrobia bacterium]|nr:hypothetical protein [Verrucomicrobiota bacterium]